MIVERGRGRAVHIRYRDQDGERQTLIERDCYPYCFVETADQDIFDAVYKEDGFTGLYGEKLTKLVVNDPQQIMEIQERADTYGVKTWEANIPYVNRVLADRTNPDDPIPNYDHRIWYLDCEWNPETNAMRVMVFHDNFTGNTE